MPPTQDALTLLADGVWTCPHPVSFLGLELTATMSVLRLADGTLLLYSPVALTAARRASVEALGPVAHLYAPNTYHASWIGEWAAAFPKAKLHAPAGLVRKRPDLRIDRVHASAAEPAFAGVTEFAIAGFRLQESVLFHAPAKTLVVADLVHNVRRVSHGWTKTYTQWMGFYDRVALSRLLRWTAFSDRAAARRSVDAVLACPFERLVVGHGAPIVSDARQALADAYSFLTP